MQGILPLTPLGALPQTPHSPCGRGISYCFFPLGKCYASLRQGRVVFSPAEKISTLCLDCVLALSALKNLFRCLFIEQPTVYTLYTHLSSNYFHHLRIVFGSSPVSLWQSAFLPSGCVFRHSSTIFDFSGLPPLVHSPISTLKAL